jgi:uncharacterized protein (DUF849 family)
VSREVVITCAVTGSHQNFQRHPNYPITPEQIADACIEAREAGAAVTHIHVRDPETGAPSGDLALYRRVVERVRGKGCDVLINLTTGEGGRYIPSEDNPAVGGPGTTVRLPLERLRHVEELLPDICSLDVGTANFGEQVFMNTAPHLRIMARRIHELGVKPEMEVFELGHVVLAKALIADGLIEAPPLFQICLGIAYAAPATAQVMTLMRDLLPAGANWASFGISRFQFPMAAQAVTLGGHVRVGLEDNLYLARDTWASNGSLVEKAVRIVRDLGGEVAEPERARELLGLPARAPG